MANNIETVFTAKTDQFEAGVRKASNTLKTETGQMRDALKSAGGGMDALNDATKKLASAQMQASAQFKAAKQAYTQGTIGLEEYRRKQIETRTALGLVRSEHSQLVNQLKRGDSSVTSTRFGMQNLGFQLQDVAVQFSGGTSAARIFAMQGPQIVGAVQMMNNSTSKFATFMAGPWGVALGVGVAVLGTLATKLFDTGEETSKTERASRSFTEVLRDNASSWDEVRKAAKDYADQLQKNRAITLQTIEDEGRATEARLKAAMAIREQLRAELERKQSILEDAMRAGGDPDTAGLALIGPAADVRSVQRRVDENKKALADLQRAAGELRIKTADAIAELNSDPQAKVKAGFDILRDSARRTITDVEKLTARLTELNKQEAAALKEMQASSRRTSTNALSVTPGDVARILGVTPTSGTRNAAQNKAADGAKNSFHLSGQAIDFPLGKWSKELIRETLERAGIRILELLGPGDKGHSDHFHVAFAKTRRSPEDVSEALAREAERAREDAIRRQRDFDTQGSVLDRAILDAKQAMVTDAGELAQLAKQEIAVAAQKYGAQVEAKVQLGDLTRAQADELQIKNAIVAALQAQKIDMDEARRKADEAFQVQQAANDNERTILGLQESLAQTAADRRTVQLRILDLEKQQEKAALEKQAADQTLNDATREIARRRLAQLDAEYSLRGQGIVNSTRGPLESYLADMDPSRIGERVQTAMVEELEAVRRGINDAISNALGIEDPFLRSLIDLFIQQVLIRPITQALSNAMGSSGGLFGSIIGGVGGLIGGGGGIVPGEILMGGAGGFSGFAKGTRSAPPGTAWVGENGPELVRFRGGEGVFNMAQLAGLAANNNAANVTINMAASGNPRADRQSAEQAAHAVKRVLNGPMRR